MEVLRVTDFVSFRSIFSRPGVDKAFLQTPIKILKQCPALNCVKMLDPL